MIKVAVASAVQAFASAANAFVIPIFIGAYQYGLLRTFLLYTAYLGIFHFGYIDGILLKYAGKNIDEVNKANLKNEHSLLVLMQGVVTLLVILTGIIIKDNILILLGFSVIPVNLQTYASSFYLATKQMWLFSIIRYIPLINLVLNSILFLFGIKDYIYYCVIYIISNLLVTLYYEKTFNFLRKFKLEIWKEINQIKIIFKTGILALTGNILAVSFFSIDKWVINIFFDKQVFGIYSFAMSFMQIISLIITTIAVGLYPYLVKEGKRENFIKLNNFLSVLSALSMALYFIMSIIIKNYITEYTESIELLRYLILGTPALIFSNCIFINLYKTEQRVKKYIVLFFVFCIVNGILNYLLLMMFKNQLYIVLTNLFMYYVFLFYSSSKNKLAELTIKDILFILFSISIYLLANLIKNEILAGVFYTSIISISIYVIYKDIIYYILNDIKKILPIKKTFNKL